MHRNFGMVRTPQKSNSFLPCSALTEIHRTSSQSGGDFKPGNKNSLDFIVSFFIFLLVYIFYKILFYNIMFHFMIFHFSHSIRSFSIFPSFFSPFLFLPSYFISLFSLTSDSDFFHVHCTLTSSHYWSFLKPLHSRFYIFPHLSIHCLLPSGVVQRSRTGSRWCAGGTCPPRGSGTVRLGPTGPRVLLVSGILGRDPETESRLIVVPNAFSTFFYISQFAFFSLWKSCFPSVQSFSLVFSSLRGPALVTVAASTKISYFLRATLPSFFGIKTSPFPESSQMMDRRMHAENWILFPKIIRPPQFRTSGREGRVLDPSCLNGWMFGRPPLGVDTEAWPGLVHHLRRGFPREQRELPLWVLRRAPPSLICVEPPTKKFPQICFVQKLPEMLIPLKCASMNARKSCCARIFWPHPLLYSSYCWCDMH